MDFKEFCKEDRLFTFKPPFPELTGAFYMDCFMNHQLQELLYPQKNEKSSEPPGNVQKKDFQDMLHSLIKRIPSYNRRKKKSEDEYKNADNETAEQQQFKKRIEDCEKWFYSILYPKNPDMCINLAPIIIFILVDSYPFFKKNVKGNKEKSQFDLYKYIVECLNGKYRDAYLFSLLRNSPPSRKIDSVQMGAEQLKKITKKSFGLKCIQTNHPVRTPDGSMAESKTCDYELWESGIVCEYKLDKYEDELNKDDDSLESPVWINTTYGSTTVFKNREDWIAKSYFDLFNKMFFKTNFSCNKSRSCQTYTIPSRIWADLLDFNYKDLEQLAPIRSIRKRSCDGKRNDYNWAEHNCGENVISLICYLNDLESKEYFDRKYDRSLIIYTLNKMTQWITPFTTLTEQNKFPAYNPDFIFACHCYNHTNDGFAYTSEYFRWREIDSASNIIEKYKDVFYKHFIPWYGSASTSNKKTFNNQLEKYTKEIFYSFIYCPNDYIYFPINKSSIAPVDSITNPIKDSKTDCLGFYYCICDRFHYHIGPQITQSFATTCKEWLNNNAIWTEFTEKCKDFNFLIMYITNKAYLEDESREELIKTLEQELGASFGKYLGEHLDEYLHEDSEVLINKTDFGGSLVLENFEAIMKKYKENVRKDSKIDYLYPFLP